MTTINRYTPYFISATLPLLLFSWFMPKGVVQVDLWLLWLLAMVMVGLPMLFLEFALAKRSNNSVWQGMQVLTRESDAPTYWRIFSLLSVVFALALGAGLIARFSETLAVSNDLKSLDATSYAIGFVLGVIALILSPLNQKTVGVGLIFVVIATGLSILSGNLDIAMTDTSFGEWSLAVTMSLFSMGLGTGLYWFLDNLAPKPQSQKPALSSVVLPIWIAQLIFGVAGFGAASTPLTPVATFVATIGVVLIASFLFRYAITQLKVRFGLITGIGIGVIVALSLSAIPSTLLSYLISIVGLLTALSLSVFAGFVMKASHLRKSLNFSNELRYNLWRVAVRWLVPLAIISALIGLAFR